MAKTLITLEGLDMYIQDGKLVLDSSKIITPGARDELYKRGVELEYSPAPHEAPGHSCAEDTPGAHCAQAGAYPEDLLLGVASIIRQHYGITDPDDLRKVTLETVAAIGNCLEK
ncbi:MAG: hypothetical protein HY916_10545 [Desulfovibrio sp.]|jgi:hypothetical protein|nr:hypothetical protein [Desulfovibrio sp.]